MGCFVINSYENKPLFIHKKVFQRLSDIFHQEAFDSISKVTGKLRTYGFLKKEIGMEKYLTTIKNPTIRKTMTKFRLSNHRLRIEVGRHQNTPKELRLCKLCSNLVESEIK